MRLQMTGLLPIVRDVTAIHHSRSHYPLINMHVPSLITLNNVYDSDYEAWIFLCDLKCT